VEDDGIIRRRRRSDEDDDDRGDLDAMPPPDATWGNDVAT